MLNNTNLTTWVVVADKCQATIYQIVKFPKLKQIKVLEHPESRLHDRDLVTTKPGRTFQRGGSTRHSYQPEVGPKQMEVIKFATELGKYLVEEENQKTFNRLYIIAEPAFLGVLRQHINNGVKKTIVSEIAKDLTNSNTEAIESLIENL